MRLIADIAIHLPAQYLPEIGKNVVYAPRMLAKSPGFTAFLLIRAFAAYTPMMTKNLAQVNDDPGLLFAAPLLLAALRDAGLLPAGEACDEDRSHERAAGGIAGESVLIERCQNSCRCCCSCWPPYWKLVAIGWFAKESIRCRGSA